MNYDRISEAQENYRHSKDYAYIREQLQLDRVLTKAKKGGERGDHRKLDPFLPPGTKTFLQRPVPILLASPFLPGPQTKTEGEAERKVEIEKILTVHARGEFWRSRAEGK